MLNSLQRYARNKFHVYVFTFDDLSYKILTDLSLENISVISLNEFETPELLEVKKERTKAEYCWTCTPAVIKHVFKKYKVQNCTYIDADLMFYEDPSVLLSELNTENTVLITEHRYSFMERIYEGKRAGRFCVQFITFNTLEESQLILNTWAGQCIEWCYNRYEDSKFGDQKYLDEWPARYKGVHILENEGGGVAPWNIKKYKFIKKDDEIMIEKKQSKKKFKLVFFHFQSLKLKENNTADLGWHHINKKLRKTIYSAYINNLMKVEQMLSDNYNEYSRQYYTPENRSLRNIIKNSFKKITSYNIYKF